LARLEMAVATAMRMASERRLNGAECRLEVVRWLTAG